MRLPLAAALLAALLVGCACGNHDWRRESYQAAAGLRAEWAGDGRCSDPAPWTSFEACHGHDLAYEHARRERCAGRESDRYTSEQARLIADLNLAHQMAYDGYPEVWVAVYYVAVRWGGWWSYHFSGCPP